jgi:hypothetical protein
MTWLECVEAELLGRKLPRQEVARLVAELTDHLSDLADFQGDLDPQPTAGTPFSPLPPSLKEEPMSTEAIAVNCLGSPAEIADTAVREFRQRKNLLARSRLATFGIFVLLPLPLLVIAWLVSMFAVETSLELLLAGLERSGIVPEASAGAIDPVEFIRDRLRNGAQFDIMILHFLLIAILSIPAAGLAALFGRLARRTSRRWLWGLTACTLVSLGFGAAQYDLTISDRPGKSQLLFMVGIGRQPLQQCCYSLLPLGVGVLVLRRSGRVAERMPA